LALARHPGELDGRLLRYIERVLRSLRWRRRDVEQFAGCFLTQPKAHVAFRAPASPSFVRFGGRVRKAGASLLPASRLLFRGSTAYLNGESFAIPAGLAPAVAALADWRSAPASHIPAGEAALALLYRWYCRGYIAPGDLMK
jgi:50S ribosomal protein L16 3-hydroxylase